VGGAEPSLDERIVRNTIAKSSMESKASSQLWGGVKKEKGADYSWRRALNEFSTDDWEIER